MCPLGNTSRQLLLILPTEKRRVGFRADIGFDPSQASLDPRGLRASLGLESDVETITPAELLRRRETIRERLEKAGGG